MLVSSIIFILVIFLIPFFKCIYASSPSFVRQEIKDTINDWNFWNGSNVRIFNDQNLSITLDNAKEMSDCNSTGSYFFPDIESISYHSDGTFLNSIIWLSDEFQEPVRNSLDMYQEEVNILIKDNNKTLEQYFHIQNLTLFGISNNTINQNDTLSGRLAHSTNYTFFTDENSLTKMHIWTEFNNTIYEVIFSSLSSEFDINFEIFFKHILDSFTIRGTENNFNFSNSEDFDLYKNNNIQLIFPSEWKISEKKINKFTNVSFRSFIAHINSNAISLHCKNYGVKEKPLTH